MTFDLALCDQKQCPMNKVCLRAHARPTRWPSHFYPDWNENGCDHLILVEGATQEEMEDADA